MQADFRTLLLADTTLAAKATGGITWQHAAQAPADGKPFVVLTRIGGQPGMNHGGRSRLDSCRVQADCFAPTFAQADALREALLDVALGYTGTTGDTKFTAILPGTSRDFPRTGGLHRCLADLMVTYRPAS